MSRPRSIYAISMLSFFNSHPHFHYDQSYNLMNTDTIVLLLIFAYFLLICSIFVV